MMKTWQPEDFDIRIGQLAKGKKNTITDVPGVRVGHMTLKEGTARTGITAILPHDGNLFQEKVLATSHVINGFGKTIGLVQVNELGQIETPILLTNTLSVGTVADGLVQYMLKQNEDIGRTTGTVNPVVGECNDGYLNDIRGLHIKQEHVWQAIANADTDFAEGAVGAGTGMSNFHLKGGIGSSSRVIQMADQNYTVGVLVLANYGLLPDLQVKGVPVGQRIERLMEAGKNEASGTGTVAEERGSIIIVVATDAPVNERQLQRICKRAVIGITRMGSFIGNGSGDIVIGFSTAFRIPHYAEEPVLPWQYFHENGITTAFRAAAEATEEAVLKALLNGEKTEGRDGHTRSSLRDWLIAYPELLQP
ncbi:DmpA family aminopeptidase [Rubeoparvulum massiliense]|uniref:DmpA family aminopeptidase n=1 Tax=Rubeoparvulum massiliense TaxID=1631346 RepID=UPI00065E570C|nr:P1 family peptidase [Rubeoparvulum massiliense]